MLSSTYQHCHQKKILIADDDPAILDAISLILSDEGYVVDTTSDGDTPRRIQNELPDLLLLDIWMSGVDGRDICRYLKSQETTRGIPIVMISAMKDAEKTAIAAGADDFLAKPFDIDDLLQKVKAYLQE
jgi:DNA-binding response OmpR family regulator